uniref:Uncharacterized protein n=1 Tax=Cacopsylla melanoneura TaxID=428564 RepID=A0A8D8T467_9HEMI
MRLFWLDGCLLRGAPMNCCVGTEEVRSVVGVSEVVVVDVLVVGVSVGVEEAPLESGGFCCELSFLRLTIVNVSAVTFISSNCFPKYSEIVPSSMAISSFDIFARCSTSGVIL